MNTHQIEAIRHIKAFALRAIDQRYHKVEIYGGRAHIKFDESSFAYRFDKNFYAISPTEFLCLGDCCKLEQSFYNELSFPNEAIRCQDASYVIIAFVEVKAKKPKSHRAIFCVLARAENNQSQTLPLVASGDNLTIFWPESLKKKQ